MQKFMHSESFYFFVCKKGRRLYHSCEMTSHSEEETDHMRSTKEANCTKNQMCK